MGESLGDFDKKPTADEVKEAIEVEGGNPDAGYESKKGKLLSDGVETGK